MASRASPRSLIPSTAPMRRASRATSGVSSAATASATRKPRSASSFIQAMTVTPPKADLAGRSPARNTACIRRAGRESGATCLRMPGPRGNQSREPPGKEARPDDPRVQRRHEPAALARAFLALADGAPATPARAVPAGRGRAAHGDRAGHVHAARVGGARGRRAGHRGACSRAAPRSSTATTTGPEAGEPRRDDARRAAAVGARPAAAADLGVRGGRRDRARPQRALPPRRRRPLRRLPRLGRRPARGHGRQARCGPTRWRTPARCASCAARPRRSPRSPTPCSSAASTRCSTGATRTC